MKPIIKNYYDRDLYLTKNTYLNNGRLYLGLECIEGEELGGRVAYTGMELYGDITINLPDQMIESDNIIFADNDLSQDVTSMLEEIGLLTYLDTIQYNYGRYKKYLVDTKVMKEYL